MSTTTPTSTPGPQPAPPPAPAPVPAPQRGNLALQVGAVVTGLLIILASLSLFSVFAERVSHTTHQSFGAPTGSSLTLTSGSADVTLLADSAAGVQVDQRTSTVHGHRVGAAHLVGDRLSLPSSCVGGGLRWLFYCSVSYTVHVPSDLAVQVRLGSGDVTARGVTAGLSLRTGSGDIVGSALGSPDLSVDTGSGDVRLGFATAPTTVRATTGSGDLRIELPQGSGAYHVVQRTGSGDYSGHVDTSETSARTITAETGSGDLTIEYAG